MDTITRARELLREVADLLHQEILVRQRMMWTLTNAYGPHWLDGRPVEDVEAAVLCLRDQEMHALVGMSTVFMQLRGDRPHELRVALLHANKLLTQFIDMLYWEEFGGLGEVPRDALRLRSRKFTDVNEALGVMEALQQVNNDTIVDLGALMREFDTVRPPSGPPKE